MAKEYRVSINEDFIAPEETLLDSGSQYSNIEQPIGADVFRIAAWGIAGLFLLIFGFVFKLSIVDHEQFAFLSLQNRSSNFSVPAPRGIIFDSLGQPLVQNVPTFNLMGVSKELRPTMKSDGEVFDKVANILDTDKRELVDRLEAETKAGSVFFAATELRKDQVLAIQYLQPQGLYIVPNVKRVYPNGHQFSQIVGYVGKVNKDDLVDDNYYMPTDTIGRLGIESEYEKYLRGEHGRIFFGENTDAMSSDAITGDNVVLNIDAELQRKLYNELYKTLTEAGLSRGAAVIQNPQSGAVLAMVSFPSFDNNLFTRGLTQQEVKSILNHPSKPLFNRVISGLYNPGSTIKPLVGLAALQEHILKPTDTIQDCVSITIPNPFNKEISYTFKNWRSDLGLFNLRRSIADSCNIYFFTVGGGFGKIAGLGIERIAKYFKAAMADSVLGIDLPGEEQGFVPTPDWKEREKGESWYQGDTYNVSIGQGDLIVTPLWLNTYISGVANGGTLYQPMAANRIIDNQKNTKEVFKSKAIGSLSFRPEVLKEIKSDMEETVLSGTAKLLKDLPVRVGAKTGTAEVVKGSSINSLFTAFAPFDHPEIAITVLVEGSASNQGYALRTAREVLKWYFERKQ